MSTPLFSVIVPTRNRHRVLGLALESLAAQTLDDFEVVVTDDASTPPLSIDDFPPRLRDRSTLIRHDRARGGSASKNAGLAAARALAPHAAQRAGESPATAPLDEHKHDQKHRRQEHQDPKDVVPNVRQQYEFHGFANSINILGAVR